MLASAVPAVLALAALRSKGVAPPRSPDAANASTAGTPKVVRPSVSTAAKANASTYGRDARSNDLGSTRQGSTDSSLKAGYFSRRPVGATAGTGVPTVGLSSGFAFTAEVPAGTAEASAYASTEVTAAT